MRKEFYLIACLCLILVSCGEEGPMGPQGEQGVQGEQGIAGIDGTALLSGSGAPNNSIGKNGDFYLDKNNLDIYGPKTNAGWGEGISIKGINGVDGKDGQNGKDGVDGKDGQNGKDGDNGKDGIDGQNGKDGSKILSGTEIPTSELGNIGDFYFDIQNLTIYGPKTSTGWGTPVSLRVPNGHEVTVLLYRNHSFQKIEEDDSFVPVPEITEDQHPQVPASYYLESIIPIDSRFQEVYDNGITLVQLRRVGGHWVTSFYLQDRDEYGSTSKTLHIDVMDSDEGDDYEPSIQKDKIKIRGYASGYIKEEIEAFKIDIKIVFIPATTVIEMTAKNIDINNATNITKYLGMY